ncbi:MAG: hypothetical protein LiPW16_477 [Microgenomates group bacterium LiPW_16]|nr:MAG: hypothetical protein LiPW16_477 [Microgenomates group bacterium LiPW_16]
MKWIRGGGHEPAQNSVQGIGPPPLAGSICGNLQVELATLRISLKPHRKVGDREKFI